MFKKKSRSTATRKKETSIEPNADSDPAGGSSIEIKAVKKTLQKGLVSHTSKVSGPEKVTFESNRSAVNTRADEATRSLQTETEAERDARAQSERDDEARKARETDDSANPVYRGMNAYKQYIEKREVVDRKVHSVGPLRAPTNLRMSARFDYQPDVCKDYKETGYCTFGDSCKFLHMREDYKAGWQLDKDWEEEQKRKRARIEEAADDLERVGQESDDDEFPFACYLCREDFVNPIVTKCGHYFCEVCAFKRYAKNKRCAVCNDQTEGIFNPATKLSKWLESRKAKKASHEDEAFDAVAGLKRNISDAQMGWRVQANDI